MYGFFVNKVTINLSSNKDTVESGAQVFYVCIKYHIGKGTILGKPGHVVNLFMKKIICDCK